MGLPLAVGGGGHAGGLVRALLFGRHPTQLRISLGRPKDQVTWTTCWLHSSMSIQCASTKMTRSNAVSKWARRVISSRTLAG